MTEKESEGVVALVGCLGLVPAMAVGYVVRGWAIVTLWAWFVTPIFHVPAPSYALALGLGLIGGMLSGTSSLDTSSGKQKSVSAVIGSLYFRILIGPAISVGAGWIIKHWA